MCDQAVEVFRSSIGREHEEGFMQRQIDLIDFCCVLLSVHILSSLSWRVSWSMYRVEVSTVRCSSWKQPFQKWTCKVGSPSISLWSSSQLNVDIIIQLLYSSTTLIYTSFENDFPASRWHLPLISPWGRGPRDQGETAMTSPLCHRVHNVRTSGASRLDREK